MSGEAVNSVQNWKASMTNDQFIHEELVNGTHVYYVPGKVYRFYGACGKTMELSQAEFAVVRDFMVRVSLQHIPAQKAINDVKG